MDDLIVREYQGNQVLFQSDAYLNATEIAAKFGKAPKDYLKTDRTKKYIEAVGRNLLTDTNQLVTVIQGGDSLQQGTWFHPKLAIDFARWLNADFAVWCDEQIELILRGEPVQKPATALDALENIVSVLRQNEQRLESLESQQRYQDVKLAKIEARLDHKPAKQLTYDGQTELDFHTSVNARSPSLGGTHASPVPHDRRGHYRQYKNGRRIWIRPAKINHHQIEAES